MSLNPWTIRERLFEGPEAREDLFQHIADELGIDMGGPSEEQIREAERRRLADMEKSVAEEQERIRQRNQEKEK